MSGWLRDESPLSPGVSDDERRDDIFGLLREEGGHHTARVTPAGADWLASAGPYPRSTLSLWAARPSTPGVLPCGGAFDVVSAPAIFGRRMLNRLWSDGPGSGPVAAHRGRTLLFAAPGTAQRLPSLLAWEEWGGAAADGSPAGGGAGDGDPADDGLSVPPLLCHGAGDAVTVPPLAPGNASGPRWVVAPDTRHPWLPGPDVLLWACVRAARTAGRVARTRSRVPAHSSDQAIRPRPRSPYIDFSSRRSGC
ncbi:hypothetical protein [Streptomyces sp. SID3212]|uniref:hypothetical protein n=1 Tax=Streptomyces sp. SID3212 TaxID=2690259 RepID=UPI001F43A2EC|nr:hypothetical protein [Streptomyces sp. SID3212]